MIMDARLKLGSFIRQSLKVCDSFAFAASSQVLGAVKVYSATCKAPCYGGWTARPLNSLAGVGTPA